MPLIINTNLPVTDMNSLPRFLALFLSVLLAGPLTLLGCDAADPAAPSAVTADAPLATANAGARGPSVNGSGHFTTPRADGSDFLRRFTVSAREHADGEVTGRLNLQALGQHTQGDVTCVNFFDNVAVLAGFVTANGNGGDQEAGYYVFRVGGNFVIFVEDNGEGGGAAPDRITLVAQFFGNGEFPDLDFPDDQSVVDFACTQPLGVVQSFLSPLNDIVAGNIQVRP